MADIEKVMNGLEHCLSRYIDGLCDDCPYMGAIDKTYMVPMKCKEIIMREALELLKEQPPRKKGHWVKSKFANDRWHQCSECGRLSERTDRNGYKLVCNYCRICGADMRKGGELE